MGDPIFVGSGVLVEGIKEAILSLDLEIFSQKVVEHVFIDDEFRKMVFSLQLVPQLKQSNLIRSRSLLVILSFK